jgi:hypothetical protein
MPSQENLAAVVRISSYLIEERDQGPPGLACGRDNSRFTPMQEQLYGP